MTIAPGLVRFTGLALILVAAVVAVTWLLERAVPSPFAGYLAVVVVGLAATQLLKQQPRQRAIRMFHTYLRTRARGADEQAARERLLARASRKPARRARLDTAFETAWTGESEKERVLGGVGALLAQEQKRIEPETLAAAYDTVRDRFTIPGWAALPKEFTDEVRRRLDASEASQLETLDERYQLFRQKFFRRPMSLGVNPAASVVDFARLLHSLGNRLTKEHPGDAERAYRVSLRLRPEENLAHAGLALLLERTGRVRDAAREAQAALAVLDAYATRATDRPPTPEDISPFPSAAKLREALEQVATSG